MFLPPCAPCFAFYPLLPDFLSSASARFSLPERLPQQLREEADGEPTLFLILLLLPAFAARAPHAVRPPQLEGTPPAMDLGESEEVAVAGVRRVCVVREKAPRIRWSSASPPRPPPPPTDHISPQLTFRGGETRARPGRKRSTYSYQSLGRANYLCFDRVGGGTSAVVRR